ncbi:MAG TPA: radical SAM protein [Actinopolymorphaceae bacterium]
MSSRIRHRPEEFGGVLFDLESKAFFPLNTSGYDLFGLLARTPDRNELTEKVRQYYTDILGTAVGSAQARRVTDDFLTGMAGLGVLDDAPRDLLPPDGKALPVVSRPTERISLRAPVVVSLAVDFQCNLLCTHCYVGSTAQPRPDNLRPAELCRILDELAELEVFDVVITGGEPLMLDGIYDVLEHAKRLGFYVCLNTNGTIVSTAAAQRLRTIGVDVVKISIDSADPEVHDRFRGGRNALRRTVEGIRRLVAAGVRVDTHTVISAESTRTSDDIDAVLSLARELGVTRAHFGRVFSTGRATDELKPSDDIVLRQIAYVAELAASGEPLVGRQPSSAMPEVESMPTYDGCGGCARGIYAYVGYNGGVYPCTNLYKPEWRLGDLRRERLDTVLTESPVFADLRDRLAVAERALASHHAGHE